MKKISLLLSACMALLIVTAYAHEYMLLAYHFRVQKGDTLELHLFVADGFNIQLERPLQRNMTRSYTLITRQKAYNLLAEGKAEALPVLERKVDFDGLGLVQMERSFAKITLDNKKFAEYLHEDHIENISPATTGAGEQRERYARFIKCLVQSGAANNDTLYKTVTGQRFEIILLQNPYRLSVGDKLQAKVLFEGQPLRNKIVTIRSRTGSEPSASQESRTDANGVCAFTINRKGDWFLHVTHMIPGAEPAEADWDSFWASYSFGVE